MKKINKFASVSMLAALTLFGAVSCSGNGKDAKENSDETIPVVPGTTAVSDSTTAGQDSASIVTEELKETAADQAEKDLYRIYYKKNLINNSGAGANYAKAMKEKFASLGITEGSNQPYTTSLQSLLNRCDKVSAEVAKVTGTITGFDYDVLWLSQGDVMSFNIVVKDKKVINEDHVTIKTSFTNGDTRSRTFKMVRENGTFKIDNIDNLRQEAKQAISDGKQELKDYQSRY